MKKFMKKVLSIILSLVIFTSVFAGIDFSALSNSRPSLSEASAKDFLQFIYNEKLSDDKVKNSRYFPLLTGKFIGSDDEYKAECVAFSIFLRARVNETIGDSKYKLESSYNYLYGYLTDKLSNTKDLPNEIIEEYKSKAMDNVEEALLDFMVNSVNDSGAVKVSYDAIEWDKAIYSGVNQTLDLAGQVGKYIEYAVAAVHGCGFIRAKDCEQRLYYFSSYLSNRKSYQNRYDELFTIIDDSNFETCALNTDGSVLIDRFSWLTKKDSWINHRETIQEWAEFSYQIENSISNQKKSSDPLQYNGHTYQAFEESMTWTNAEEKCESLGGHLATITSAEEQIFIKNKVISNSSKSYYWIGGSDNDVDGVWKWIDDTVFYSDGKSVLYTNWDFGEPNNYIAKENYLEMYRSGRWNDEEEDCANSSKGRLQDHGFICEWDDTFTNINQKKQTINETHTHDFSKILIKPTCVNDGYTKYVCKICKYFYTTDFISSLGHDLIKNSAVAPTCTDKGYDKYICSRCKKVYKFKITNALGHNYSFSKTVAPTCTAQGYDLYVCSRCNNAEKHNKVKATGHKYSLTKTVLHTCKEKGYDLYTCSRCQISEKRNETEKLNGSDLKVLLEKIESVLSKTIFTDESMAALQQSYNNHKNDLSSLTSQESVDNAVKELQSAYDTLQLKEQLNGTCADGLSWRWEKSTGILTVFGTGDMADYEETTMPWYYVLPKTTGIVVSEGITKVGNYAFYNASKVESISLPSTLTTINERAFYGAGESELRIPDSVTKVGTAAFADNIALKKVYAPASADYMYSSFSKTIIDEVYVTYGKDGTVPDTKNAGVLLMAKDKPWIHAKNVIVCEGITSIGMNMFKCGSGSISGANKVTESIKFPSTLISLGDYAVFDCRCLTSVNLPEHLTSIGNFAFECCSGLTSIKIPDSVTVLGQSAFYSCTSLSDVTIGSGLNYIGSRAFGRCEKLENIVIPENIKTIEYEAFTNCGLTNVKIPNGVERIEDSAFGYNAITSVSIPASVSNISATSFTGCEGINSIEVAKDNAVYDSRENCNAVIETKSSKLVLGCKTTKIPDSVASIGDKAFYNCTGLTEVVLPEGAEFISAQAFEGCTGLKKIKIPEKMMALGRHSFYGCTSLTEVTIPKEIKYMDGEVFSKCDSLTKVSIDNSSPCLENFNDCKNLSYVYVGEGIKTINKNSLSNCPSLKEVRIMNSECEIGNNAIPANDDEVIIAHKDSTAQTYANDNSISFLSLEAIDGLKIKTVSLSLESSITMNFKVQKSAVEGFENPYVTFKCGNDKTKVTEYTQQGDYFVFSYAGISPQLMNDDVVAVLYASFKGSEFKSPEKVMSVKKYAYTMLDRCSGKEYAKLRTLLVDLLNYGTASQKYVGYQKSNLVNSELTQTQKAWASSSELELKNIRDYNYKTVEKPCCVWNGSGLVLNNSVTVRAKFSADNIDNKTVVITCGKGRFTYTKDDFVKTKDGNYYVYCDEIYANEMSSDILLTIYENGKQCSNTMRFSIESYAKLVHDNYPGTTLDELVMAMMRYGKSAQAYGA